MSKVRERTNKATHLKLTVDQYNAVYESIHEWIHEGGEKVREMVQELR